MRLTNTSLVVASAVAFLALCAGGCDTTPSSAWSVTINRRNTEVIAVIVGSKETIKAQTPEQMDDLIHNAEALVTDLKRARDQWKKDDVKPLPPIVERP